VVETAGWQLSSEILEDTTGKKLTYRRLLTGTRLLGREWRRVLAPDAAPIGCISPSRLKKAAVQTTKRKYSGSKAEGLLQKTMDSPA